PPVSRLQSPTHWHLVHAPVAQWIEYWPPKPGVAGSIPAGRAILRGLGSNRPRFWSRSRTRRPYNRRLHAIPRDHGAGSTCPCRGGRRRLAATVAAAPDADRPAGLDWPRVPCAPPAAQRGAAAWARNRRAAGKRRSRRNRRRRRRRLRRRPRRTRSSRASAARRPARRHAGGTSPRRHFPASSRRSRRSRDYPDPFGMKKRCRKPLISVVHGITYTIGIEMMLASDIVIAADTARFAQLESKRGIAPLGGAHYRYLTRTGWGNAMYHLLLCDEFGAQEAYRCGFVQEVHPFGRHRERALELAHL